MNTRPKSAQPLSQPPPLPTETFEELMEISEVPQEDLFSRILLLETQLRRLLKEHMALQLHCDWLAERVS